MLLKLVLSSLISFLVNLPKRPFARDLSSVAILLVLMSEGLSKPFNGDESIRISFGSCH